MDTQINLPSDLHASDALAVLESANNKETLATHARTHCGWRGDDARTTKRDIAAAILAHARGNGAQYAETQTQATSAARTISARFPSKCAKCSGAIQKGEMIAYVKATHSAFHPACYDANAEHGAVVGAIVERTAQAPVAPTSNANAAVAQAIAAALAGLKLGADTDDVRALVKAEMATVAETLRAEVLRQVFRVEVHNVDTGATVDVGRQHRKFPQLARALAAKCHVWLAGPAGSGKTTAAESAAAALELPFSFDGALDTEYKVLGFVDAQGRIVSTQFRKAYTEGGVHLFDECDASLAPALLAINAALANGIAAFPDGMHKKHPNFRCIAAANTWGLGATFDYVGRNKLDAAFLDRFVRIVWDYDEVLERSLPVVQQQMDWVSYVQTLRAKAKAKGIKIVISPRASIYGAQLLDAKMPLEEVIDLTMRNGMRPEDWKALQS